VLDTPPLFSFSELNQILATDSFLKDLAEKSGGRFFDASSSDVESTVNDIVSELSHTYSLAYSPSETVNKKEKRKIKVELKDKHASLRYKRAYETKSKQ
jgi:hypothetical protein